MRGVVVLGASAGGVEALTSLAAGLKPDVAFAYLMTLHMPAATPSMLARIVNRAGPLPGMTAEDGAPLEPGRICVGRRDRHLLVADHRVALSQGPTENGHCPAINALARQIAETVGHGMIFEPHVSLAEEAERALSVLSRRLTASGSRSGDGGV